MPLSELPDEIIHHIASFLRKHEIELLARTFNSKVLAVCFSLLKDWLQAIQHERKLVSLFGKINVNEAKQDDCIAAFYSHELDLRFGEPSVPRLDEHGAELRLLEYLGLNGDLRWIELPDEHTDFSELNFIDDSTPLTEAVTTQAEIEAFENACHLLGVTPPVSYIRFMGSLELPRSFSAGTFPWSSRFVFEPLLKVIVESEAAGETVVGSLSMFYTLGRSSWDDRGPPKYYYLYQDTDGGHAVLGGAFDTRTITAGHMHITADNIALGEVQANLLLESTSFEPFLVRLYFEDLAQSWTDPHPNMSIPLRLEEYLFRTYTERGRAMA